MASNEMKLLSCWDRWRRNRRKEMLQFGMSKAAASPCSRFEALGRQRIALTIGYRAAVEAELVCSPKLDGSDGFFLVIDPGELELASLVAPVD